MRKRFAILFGFLCLGLLDSLLSYVLPMNFEYTGYSVIWHWYFTGVLVFTRDKPVSTRLLIASLAGISYDLLFSGTFPVCWILYVLFAFAIGFFRNWMTTEKKQFLVYLGCLILFDLISWGIVRMSHPDLSLPFWLLHMELLTVFASSFTIVCVMFMDNVMVRFFIIQRHLERKQERKMAGKLKRRAAGAGPDSLESGRI